MAEIAKIMVYHKLPGRTVDDMLYSVDAMLSNSIMITRAGVVKEHRYINVDAMLCDLFGALISTHFLNLSPGQVRGVVSDICDSFNKR